LLYLPSVLIFFLSLGFIAILSPEGYGAPSKISLDRFDPQDVDEPHNTPTLLGFRQRAGTE
jgi:hypothetical protein